MGSEMCIRDSPSAVHSTDPVGANDVGEFASKVVGSCTDPNIAQAMTQVMQLLQAILMQQQAQAQHVPEPEPFEEEMGVGDKSSGSQEPSVGLGNGAASALGFGLINSEVVPKDGTLAVSPPSATPALQRCSEMISRETEAKASRESGRDRSRSGGNAGEVDAESTSTHLFNSRLALHN